MTAIAKVLSYTTRRNVLLLLVAYAVMGLAAIGGLVLHSNAVFGFLTALSIMLWWPITRDLAPVCYGVVVKGRWPDGDRISKLL